MAKISFKPKQVTKKLLDTLPKRARDILTSRFGLGTDTKRQTLESIGKKYGITRERVRQIEEYALKNIRKSDAFETEQAVFTELKDIINNLGLVISEQELLDELSSNDSIQNHLHFLLVLGLEFERMKEDSHFVHRWTVDPIASKKIHESIKKLYESLSNEDLLSEEEMVSRFVSHLKDVAHDYKEEEILKRWLSLSKKVAKNPLGEWGRSESPNINIKGMRDYAFLVIRRHGSPIHFKEVAEHINELFGKKAHVATCHNELIKDSRFVLVGRGLYALSEWGYAGGVVRDVIRDILDKHGPLTKEEIIDKVLKERYVKENTIMVNLQNTDHFKRKKDGKYTNA